MTLTTKKGNMYSCCTSKNVPVQKLGAIEHRAPLLLAKLCDGYCMYPQVLTSQDALDEKCESCPMKELMEMIE